MSKYEKFVYNVIFFLCIDKNMSEKHGPVCVVCGNAIDSLYIEYSQGNIRLTRCEKCGKVADKYVEYEFILVLIDLILHRRQAFRHFLFNRLNPKNMMKLSIVISIVSIITTLIIRFYLLRNSAYDSINFWTILHAFTAFLAEQITSWITLTIGLLCVPTTRTAVKTQENSLLRIYFALVFPEAIRMVAIFSLLFENESSLFLLLGLLLLSSQHMSIQGLYKLNTEQLLLSSGLVLISHVLVKRLFYSWADVWILGSIL